MPDPLTGDPCGERAMMRTPGARRSGYDVCLDGTLLVCRCQKCDKHMVFSAAFDENLVDDCLQVHLVEAHPEIGIGDWLNTTCGEGQAQRQALLVGAYVALLLAWGWVCHAYRQAGRAVAYRPGGEREL